MKIDGIPVVDATKKLKVTISPQNVKRGDNKNPNGCAAARAFCEMEGVVAAKVHITRTYLKYKDKKTKKEQWVRFQTPDAVRGEIIGFDRGGTFEPGEYQFPPIQSSLQFKNYSKRPKYKPTKLKKRKPNIRSPRHSVVGIRGHGPYR
jgi:hypothetical protein